VDDLARRVPDLRRNELNMLAHIGALNSIGGYFGEAQRLHKLEEKLKKDLALEEVTPATKAGVLLMEPNAGLNGLLHPNIRNIGRDERKRIDGHKAMLFLKSKLHRRDALWQVERAAWVEGPLLAAIPDPDSHSPLAQMTSEERLIADYHGTGLTVGPHPMQYRREEMNRMHVVRAIDLHCVNHGKFVRIAGCVIARQRPGTANGFIFLSLEDETGISNAIITPDLYDQNRLLIIHERFLLIEGILQNVENVISVKAMGVSKLEITEAATRSHDFH
jgi:error-prone DNA polymerase